MQDLRHLAVLSFPPLPLFLLLFRVDYTLDLDVDVIVNEGSGHIAMGTQTSILTSDSGNLAYAVETCKCNGLNFVCDTDPVGPNTDLHLCYKSVSSDVEIENIEFMVSMITMAFAIYVAVLLSHLLPSIEGCVSGTARHGYDRSHLHDLHYRHERARPERYPCHDEASAQHVCVR